MSSNPRRRDARVHMTLVPRPRLVAVALVGRRLRQQRREQQRRRSAPPARRIVSAAKQLLDESATRPTQITQTKPIDKPIPTGKKITFISCGVEACAVQGPILAEGAKILGWSVTQVGTDGSPEKVQNAFQAAVRDGANAVIINAADK